MDLYLGCERVGAAVATSLPAGVWTGRVVVGAVDVVEDDGDRLAAEEAAGKGVARTAVTEVITATMAQTGETELTAFRLRHRHDGTHAETDQDGLF